MGEITSMKLKFLRKLKVNVVKQSFPVLVEVHRSAARPTYCTCRWQSSKFPFVGRCFKSAKIIQKLQENQRFLPNTLDTSSVFMRELEKTTQIVPIVEKNCFFAYSIKRVFPSNILLFFTVFMGWNSKLKN